MKRPCPLSNLTSSAPFQLPRKGMSHRMRHHGVSTQTKRIPRVPSVTGRGWKWWRAEARAAAGVARRSNDQGSLPRRASRDVTSSVRWQTIRLTSVNGTQLGAFNYAFKLVDEYPAIERGLLLMGTVGVGKTHLSIAILRGLVEKGVSCLFYECGRDVRLPLIRGHTTSGGLYYTDDWHAYASLGVRGEHVVVTKERGIPAALR